MRSDRWERVRSIFSDASELPAADQEGFVRRLAGDDAALAAEVLRLLAAAGDFGRFDDLARWAAETLGERTAETFDAGRRVGPWAIVRSIGRGGMGDVYLAERADGQFVQRVALKVLRHDADTTDIRRRFLAERQILASVEHPNIARLVDGGIADEGWPYIAMEYVDGVPIDVYCDTRRLDVDARLALFRTLCDAVQHAHRHLVVHRDIKPGNVLVAEHGALKLLDFGIAKLLDPAGFGLKGEETATVARMLTPDWASPEQLRGEAVTTASDVYQLGLILHALIAGPRLSIAAAATVPPARPAATVRPSSIVAHDATIAAARGTTPEKLARRLRGDLDVIVAMATRPEPQRRFASVERLADDVRRHLDGLPVTARPDTVVYRTGKFVRRHTGGVVAAGLALTALLVFTVSTAFQSTRIRRERDRADRVAALLGGIFGSANPVETPRADTLTVRAALDRGVVQLRGQLADDPDVLVRLLTDIARAYRGLGLYDQADSLFAEVLALQRGPLGEDDATIAASMLALGRVRFENGHTASALQLARETMPLLPARGQQLAEARNLEGIALQAGGQFGDARIAFERALTESTDSLFRVRVLVSLGYTLETLGDVDTAERVLREALDIQRAHPADLTRLASVLEVLGRVMRAAGRPQEALLYTADAVATLRSVYPDRHVRIGDALRGHASSLAAAGDETGAEQAYAEAISILRATETGVRGRLAHTLANYGTFLEARGLLDSAAIALTEARALYIEAFGPQHLSTAVTTSNLGRVNLSARRYAEAVQLLAEGVPAARAAWPADDVRLGQYLADYGIALAGLGRADTAEIVLRDALRIERMHRRPGDWQHVRAQSLLGEVLARSGRFAEAEPLLLASLAALRQRAPEDVFLRRATATMAAFYQQWGKPEEAAKYGDSAIR